MKSSGKKTSKPAPQKLRSVTIAKYVLKWGIFLIGLVLSIIHFIPGNNFPKLWSYLATMALPFAIDILRLFKVKVSEELEVAYLVFIIPAMVMGIDFDVYKIIYPFDKVAHFFSGILAAYGAREIMDQASGQPDQMWFKILFGISFVAFTAAIWECFEFSCDQLLGQNMQQLIAPGIEDTMYDIIVALIGGIIGTVLAFPVHAKMTKK